jgi:hypothetical protein
MNSTKDFLLLFQLIRGVNENTLRLQEAYKDSNKDEFDAYSKKILEYQKKIAFILG